MPVGARCLRRLHAHVSAGAILSNQTATTAEKTPLARSQTQNSAQTHGLPHSVYAAWRTALSVLRFYLLDSANFLRIVHAEVRSLRGRICVLRDKKRAAGNQRPVVIVGLGPMFEALPNGHLLLCRETLSRNEGIETMSAKFPWVSAVDELLILEGWEMGKQFALGIMGTACRDTEQAYLPASDQLALTTKRNIHQVNQFFQ